MACIPKQVADLNTQHACGEMRKLGIVPKRAFILADDLQDIAHAVHEMSENYTAVITMGGIGKVFLQGESLICACVNGSFFVNGSFKCWCRKVGNLLAGHCEKNPRLSS